MLPALDRRRPRFKPEAVRLADHGIAANPAQFIGDLARGHALTPELLEMIDPFVRPRHIHSSASPASCERAGEPIGEEPMSDQPKNIIYSAPGVPVIPFINWGGMRALYVKEVRRFFKVQLQTIWAPAITTLLYLVIFTVAMDRGGRLVLGVPFATFVAPGLIMMGMMQNAFANGSFSLLSGKMQGTIIDYLMPPLSAGEVIGALIGAAVTRAVCVGFAVWFVMLFWPGVEVMPVHLWAIVWFGITGSAMLAFLGLLTSIWADKFDHAAAITNFVVAPLSLLSGTFYSVENLHASFRTISHANPFFYVISGFRYGFLGSADSPILIGSIVLLVVNIVLAAVSYKLFAAGWKIKS
jgi:ABC-2 type transport system permease protein